MEKGEISANFDSLNLEIKQTYFGLFFPLHLSNAILSNFITLSSYIKNMLFLGKCFGALVKAY